MWRLIVVLLCVLIVAGGCSIEDMVVELTWRAIGPHVDAWVGSWLPSWLDGLSAGVLRIDWI